MAAEVRAAVVPEDGPGPSPGREPEPPRLDSRGNRRQTESLEGVPDPDIVMEHRQRALHLNLPEVTYIGHLPGVGLAESHGLRRKESQKPNSQASRAVICMLTQVAEELNQAQAEFEYRKQLKREAQSFRLRGQLLEAEVLEEVANAALPSEVSAALARDMSTMTAVRAAQQLLPARPPSRSPSRIRPVAVPAILATKKAEQRWGHFSSAPWINPEAPKFSGPRAVQLAGEDTPEELEESKSKNISKFIQQGSSWQTMMQERKRTAYMARLSEILAANMDRVNREFAARMIQRAWRKHRGMVDTAAQKMADLEAELEAAEAEVIGLQGTVLPGDDKEGLLSSVVNAAWKKNKLRDFRKNPNSLAQQRSMGKQMSSKTSAALAKLPSAKIAFGAHERVVKPKGPRTTLVLPRVSVTGGAPNGAPSPTTLRMSMTGGAGGGSVPRVSFSGAAAAQAEDAVSPLLRTSCSGEGSGCLVLGLSSNPKRVARSSSRRVSSTGGGASGLVSPTGSMGPSQHPTSGGNQDAWLAIEEQLLHHWHDAEGAEDEGVGSGTEEWVAGSEELAGEGTLDFPAAPSRPGSALVPLDADEADDEQLEPGAEAGGGRGGGHMMRAANKSAARQNRVTAPAQFTLNALERSKHRVAPVAGFTKISDRLAAAAANAAAARFARHAARETSSSGAPPPTGTSSWMGGPVPLGASAVQIRGLLPGAAGAGGPGASRGDGGDGSDDEAWGLPPLLPEGAPELLDTLNAPISAGYAPRARHNGSPAPGALNQGRLIRGLPLLGRTAGREQWQGQGLGQGGHQSDPFDVMFAVTRMAVAPPASPMSRRPAPRPAAVLGVRAEGLGPRAGGEGGGAAARPPGEAELQGEDSGGLGVRLGGKVRAAGGDAQPAAGAAAGAAGLGAAAKQGGAWRPGGQAASKGPAAAPAAGRLAGPPKQASTGFGGQAPGGVHAGGHLRWGPTAAGPVSAEPLLMISRVQGKGSEPPSAAAAAAAPVPQAAGMMSIQQKLESRGAGQLLSVHPLQSKGPQEAVRLPAYPAKAKGDRTPSRPVKGDAGLAGVGGLQGLGVAPPTPTGPGPAPAPAVPPLSPSPPPRSPGRQVQMQVPPPMSPARQAGRSSPVRGSRDLTSSLGWAAGSTSTTSRRGPGLSTALARWANDQSKEPEEPADDVQTLMLGLFGAPPPDPVIALEAILTQETMHLDEDFRQSVEMAITERRPPKLRASVGFRVKARAVAVARTRVRAGALRPHLARAKVKWQQRQQRQQQRDAKQAHAQTQDGELQASEQELEEEQAEEQEGEPGEEELDAPEQQQEQEQEQGQRAAQGEQAGLSEEPQTSVVEAQANIRPKSIHPSEGKSLKVRLYDIGASSNGRRRHPELHHVPRPALNVHQQEDVEVAVMRVRLLQEAIHGLQPKVQAEQTARAVAGAVAAAREQGVATAGLNILGHNFSLSFGKRSRSIHSSPVKQQQEQQQQQQQQQQQLQHLHQHNSLPRQQQQQQQPHLQQHHSLPRQQQQQQQQRVALLQDEELQPHISLDMMLQQQPLVQRPTSGYQAQPDPEDSRGSRTSLDFLPQHHLHLLNDPGWAAGARGSGTASSPSIASPQLQPGSPLEAVHGAAVWSPSPPSPSLPNPGPREPHARRPRRLSAGPLSTLCGMGLLLRKQAMPPPPQPVQQSQQTPFGCPPVGASRHPPAAPTLSSARPSVSCSVIGSGYSKPATGLTSNKTSPSSGTGSIQSYRSSPASPRLDGLGVTALSNPSSATSLPQIRLSTQGSGEAAEILQQHSGDSRRLPRLPSITGGEPPSSPDTPTIVMSSLFPPSMAGGGSLSDIHVRPIGSDPGSADRTQERERGCRSPPSPNLPDGSCKTPGTSPGAGLPRPQYKAPPTSHSGQSASSPSTVFKELQLSLPSLGSGGPNLKMDACPPGLPVFMVSRQLAGGRLRRSTDMVGQLHRDRTPESTGSGIMGQDSP